VQPSENAFPIQQTQSERALSNRMTRSAQLAYTGLLQFYGGQRRDCEDARPLGAPSLLAIADEVIEKSSGSGCAFSLTSTEIPAVVENGKSNKNRLRVRRVVDVPLREVSVFACVAAETVGCF
jgi:hypothetical protein